MVTSSAVKCSTMAELSVGTREKLGKVPLPWWHVWRLAEKTGVAPKRPVVFECAGAPGVLQSILDGAPFFTRVVVVGICIQPDTVEPAMGVTKEIDLRFVLGYSPLEFRDTLHMIAEGKINCAALAKILIDPSSTATAPANKI